MSDETFTEWFDKFLEDWEAALYPIYEIDTYEGMKPGDILHIKVGINDMGDGMPPFIPGPSELAAAEEEFKKVVPEGVKVIATHQGYDVTVLQVAAEEE